MARTTIRSEDITAGQIKSADLETNVVIDGDLTVDTDTLYVDSTNNRVGIGTSSPTQAGLVIHKYGLSGTRLALKSNETSADTYLRIGRYGTGDDATFYIGNNYNRDSGGFSADYSSYGVTDINFNNGYLSFGTGAAGQNQTTERMRITSGGGVNVGSGVLSAASNDGDIVADLGVVIGTYNGDNRIAASSLGGGSATLYIGNAAIQVSSDERLKTNIADTTMSAVDKIKQVRIVDFNWNDPSDTSYNNRNARGTWTGVIAQELIDVFPFAVNAPRKEEDLSIDIESEKKWQVDQAHLVPVLMKAIQEQQTIIESLEARVAVLEAN